MQSMQPFVHACPPGIASHWSMQLPTHKAAGCNSIQRAAATAAAAAAGSSSRQQQQEEEQQEVQELQQRPAAAAAAANLYCVGGHAPHAAIIVASFDLIGRESLGCSDSL